MLFINSFIYVLIFYEICIIKVFLKVFILSKNIQYKSESLIRIIYCKKWSGLKKTLGLNDTNNFLQLSLPTVILVSGAVRTDKSH